MFASFRRLTRGRFSSSVLSLFGVIAAFGGCSSSSESLEPTESVGAVEQAVQSCTGVGEYASGTPYVAGMQVQHNGVVYECQAWPASGWCPSIAYEPGVSVYWQDAWTLVDTCAAGSGGQSGAGGSSGGAGGAPASGGNSGSGGEGGTGPDLPANIERIMGFEAPLTDWSASDGGLVGETGSILQGQKSLTLGGPTTWTSLASVPFAWPGVSSLTTLGFDVRIPTPTTEPGWWGNVVLKIESQSESFSQTIGSQQLDSTALDYFRRIEFQLNSATSSFLAASHADVRFVLEVNVPSDTGPFEFDRMTFSSQPSQPISDHAPSDNIDRILSFESLGDWAVSSGTATLGTDSSDLEYSLQVQGTSYADITTRTRIRSLINVTDTATLDVKLPLDEPNPSWHGHVSLAVHLPSEGLSWRWISTVSLEGLSPGVWGKVQFELPSDVVEALEEEYSDLQFKIGLSVPVASGAYEIDNLDLGQPRVPAPTGQQKIHIVLPVGATLQNVAIAPAGLATEYTSTRLSPGGITLNVTQVKTPNGGWSGVVDRPWINMGLTIGERSHVGNVWSSTGLLLGEDAQVHGDARLRAPTGYFSPHIRPSVFNEPVGRVLGSTYTNQRVAWADVAGWVVDPVPGGPTPPEEGTLAPGDYGSLVVATGKVITLLPGEYSFKTIGVHQGGELKLDNRNGAIIIRDDGAFGMAPYAILTVMNRDVNNVAFVHLAKNPIVINSAEWFGMLVAPNAFVTTGPASGSMLGAIYAKGIDLLGATVTHLPFSRTECTNVAQNCGHLFGCEVLDSDRDSIPDCEEERDSSPWTDPAAFNGISTSNGFDALECPELSACGDLDERSEIDACMDDDLHDKIDQYAGWDFSFVTVSGCARGYSFAPHFNDCEANVSYGYPHAYSGWGLQSTGYVFVERAGKHCFKLDGLEEACGSLFLDGAEAGQTFEDGNTCYELEAGAHPISWAFSFNLAPPHTTSAPEGFHLRYCYGGEEDCVATLPLPSNMLRPEYDGSSLCEGQACSPVCPCTTGSGPCESSDECEEGLICGPNNGLHFGDSAGKRYCWPPQCEGTLVTTACGYPGATCGLCTGDVPDGGYADPPLLPPVVYVPPDAPDPSEVDGTITTGVITTPRPENAIIPGALTGTSLVGNDGSFSYSIPLDVPKGINGHTPQLSLSYNSRTGMDTLGVGWSLGGLSKIHRCAKSRAKSGVARAVTFAGVDSEELDDFCIDGERLVVRSGTSGGDGARYSREVDDFSRITSSGVVAGEPERFTVQTKAGQKLTYSYRAGYPRRLYDYLGQVVEDSTGTLSWHLSKIEDRSGNSIDIAYSQNKLGGTKHAPVPTSVTYAEGKFEIEFVYGILDGVWPQASSPQNCVSGVCQGYKPLLQKVLIASEGTKQWSYEFDYELGAGSGRTRLAQATWCDATGGCFAPTKFQWNDIVSDQVRDNHGSQFRLWWESEPLDLHLPSVWTQPVLADFNGDGFQDLLYHVIDPDDPYYEAGDCSGGYGGTKVLLRLGRGVDYDYGPSYTFPQGADFPELFDTPIDISALFDNGGFFFQVNKSRFVDFDGDGRTEILAWQTEFGGPQSGQYQLFKWNGSTMVKAQDSSWTLPFDNEETIDLGDADGDGRIDLFVASGGWNDLSTGVNLLLTQAGGADGFRRGTTPIVIDNINFPQLGRSFVSDLNGDGRAAIMGDGVYDLASLDPSEQFDTPGVSEQHYGDVNGDGLADAIYIEPFTGRIDVRINAGRSFLPADVWGHTDALDIDGPGRNQVRVADFNGDGLADLMLLAAGGPSDASICFTERFTEPPTILVSSGSFFTEGPSFANYVEFGGGRLVHAYSSGSTKGWSGHTVGDIDGNGVSEYLALEQDGDENIRLRLHGLSRRVSTLLGVDRAEAISVGGDLLTKVEPPKLEPDTVVYAGLIRRQIEEDIVHVPSTDCVWPQKCLRTGMTVVREFQGDASRYRPWVYQYEGARTDVQGRGFLGFERRSQSESGTGYSTIQFDVETRRSVGGNSDISYVYPFAALAESVESFSFLGGGEVREVEAVSSYSSESDGWPFTVRLDRQVNRTFIGPGGSGTPVLQLTSTSEFLYDAYGNATSVETTTSENGDKNGDGVTEVAKATIVSTFDNRDDSRWQLGLLERVEETRQLTGAGTKTRTVEFDYNGAGLRIRSIVEPEGDASVRSEEALTRNAKGVITATTRSAPGESPRTTSITYDSDGLYPRTATNQLGHVAHFIFHPTLGVLLSYTDANGATSKTSYDWLGRPVQRRLVGTDVVDYRYGYGALATQEGVHGVSVDESVLVVKGTNRPRTILASNGRGQVTAEYVDLPDGRVSTTEAVYDERGLLYWLSLPHEDATVAPGAIQLEYDPQDRLRLIQNPDGTIRSVDYEGLFKTSSADESGRVQEEIRGLAGVTRATKRQGSFSATTRFGYHAFGELRFARSPEGHTTSHVVDILGRAILVNDPDAGFAAQTYNGFGELVSSWTGGTSPSGVEALYHTTQEYDALGRMTRVTTECGEDVEKCRDEERVFTWDGALNAAGKLVRAQSLTDGVTTTYSYGAGGRPEAEELFIDGETFAHQILYASNASNRATGVAYPDVPGRERFSIQFGYDALGQLNKVSDPARTYWQVLTRDIDGRILSTRHRDGTNPGVVRSSEFDTLTRRLTALESAVESGATSSPRQRFEYEYWTNGALRERRRFDLDGGSGLAEIAGENFDYDFADRLQSWSHRSDDARVDWTYTYDRDGNIDDAQRWDVAADPVLHVETYSYGGGAGPHAVRAHDGETFEYDSAGRMVSRSSNSRGDLEFFPTSFDLPFRVLKEDESGLTRVTDFRYDAFGRRTVRQTSDEKVIYVGPTYERRSKVSETGVWSDKHVFKVRSPEGQVAEVTYSVGDEETSHEEVLFVHADPLGSASTLLSATGDVVASQQFDPWGLRIGENGYPLSERPLEGFRSGFTGHEHDDDLGLINMGGRLYDPHLRRVVSVDPMVVGFGADAWNPYVYALNNPLRYVDPSGFCTEAALNSEEGCELGSYEVGPDGTEYWTAKGSMKVLPSKGSTPPAGPSEPKPKPSGGIQGFGNAGSDAQRTDVSYVSASSDSTQNAPGGPVSTEPRTSVMSEPGSDDETVVFARAVVAELNRRTTEYRRLLVVDETCLSGETCGPAEQALEVISILPVGKVAKLIRMERAAATAARVATAGVKDVLTLGRFKLTQTVANHATDVVKKGPFKGQLARPYLNSPHTVEQILQAGRGVPDPGGVVGALRWDVPGTFRGSEGTWQLVMKNDTILHFNFISQ